jgi:uncharacterized protein
MPSTGLDRTTGKPLSGLAHVRQCFVVIFTTRIGERVMRRSFGSNVPAILGRNLVPSTLTLFFAAIILAVDLWEPRLRIVQVLYPAPPNAPSTLRVGNLTLAIIADYRPNALQGDVTTDVQRIYL